MKKITFFQLFDLFLKALKFDAKIEQKAYRLVAKRGNCQFILTESTKKIMLKEYFADFNGFEYEKKMRVFLYRIVEDFGNVKVIDENNRAILVLTSTHEIVKISSEKEKAIAKPVEFKNKSELLDYKAVESNTAQPTLF